MRAVRILLSMLLSWVLASAALAETRTLGPVQIDLPAGWVIEESDGLLLAASPDQQSLIIVVPNLQASDPADGARRMAQLLTEGETIERLTDPQALPDLALPAQLAASASRGSDGAAIYRLYAALGQPGAMIGLVLAAPDQARLEALQDVYLASIASARMVAPAGPVTAPPTNPSVTPLSGGIPLDGVFVGSSLTTYEPRVGETGMAWSFLVLMFYPDGSVVRDAIHGNVNRPPFAEACAQRTAQNCGSYLIEGGQIRFQWRDGTIETETIDLDHSYGPSRPQLKGLKIGRASYYAPTLLPDGTVLEGLYGFQARDGRNRPAPDGLPPMIRFGRDGTFALVADASQRDLPLSSPAFGPEVKGQYRITGNLIVLTYGNGFAATVGIFRNAWEDEELILAGEEYAPQR